MTIELVVEEQPYSQFTSATINLSLDSLSSSFFFSAVSTENNALPFKGGEECTVLVEGDLVLTGSIEIVNVSYTGESHEITIEGRDRTGDLLDSDLTEISDIKSPISLADIIRKVTHSLDADINVIEQTKTKVFNEAEDIASPEPGQNAFEFIESFARKRQVLLTSDNAGDIIITANAETPINVTLQNILNSSSNNILEASVSYDTTNRFNKYVLESSLNPTSLNSAGDIDLISIASQRGGSIDDDIRLTRQRVILAENSSSTEQAILRSKWEANIRKARSRVYSAKVDGARNTTGSLWEINKIVTVIDVFAGIDSQMLINSVTFNLSEDGGLTTTLSLLNKDAYTLALNEPTAENLGDEFFS